jgi:hypothetical protein
MTFQAIQAVAIPQSESLTSEEYIGTGTDLDEARQWAKVNGIQLEDLDDISDDLADAGWLPRDDGTV